MPTPPSPPPATWPQILAPEPFVEDAVHAVLAGRSPALGLGLHRRLEAEPLNAPTHSARLEIACLLGAETGHRGFFKAGCATPDAWAGQIRITSRRLRSSAARAAHWTLLGRIREAMLPAAALFTAANLPYHSISKITMGTPEATYDTNGNEDGTVLVWDVVVNVRPGAWPATDPGA